MMVCLAPLLNNKTGSTHVFLQEYPKKGHRPSRTTRKLPQWPLSSPSPQVRMKSEKCDAANLALLLTKKGKRVTLADLDIGGADIQSCSD